MLGVWGLCGFGSVEGNLFGGGGGRGAENDGGWGGSRWGGRRKG
jgi:hypothetical protein